MEFDLSKKHCYFFNEICKIPHGSHNEKGISDYLVSFAKERNLKCVQDKVYNVVIYKDASKGYENSAPIILQGHMDMVCEVNRGTEFDFEKDSLSLRVEDDWLMATDTTLGADDGVAVAYMLAVLDDETIAHPALECCFTVSEETGLQGALNFDKNNITAKRMVCLDSSGEIVTTVSCAGGTRAITSLKGTLIDNDKNTYSLFVSGLKGGHSAKFINSGRTNSIITANRIVKEATKKGIDISLVSIEGGLKENAIPRECECIFASTSDFEEIKKAFKESFDNIAYEYAVGEPDMKYELKEVAKADKVFDETSTAKVLNLIYLIPNGFKERSLEIEGLTLTSLNLGVIRTINDTVRLTDCIRSAIDSSKMNLVNEIKALAECLGAEVELQAPYPGWNYLKDCPLRDVLGKAIKDNTGKDMLIEATHGGNECGVFSSFGVKEIVAYGPIMEDIHTPKEKLSLKSFDTCYKVLVQVLKDAK